MADRSIRIGKVSSIDYGSGMIKSHIQILIIP